MSENEFSPVLKGKDSLKVLKGEDSQTTPSQSPATSPVWTPLSTSPELPVLPCTFIFQGTTPSYQGTNLLHVSKLLPLFFFFISIWYAHLPIFPFDMPKIRSMLNNFAKAFRPQWNCLKAFYHHNLFYAPQISVIIFINIIFIIMRRKYPW